MPPQAQPSRSRSKAESSDWCLVPLLLPPPVLRTLTPSYSSTVVGLRPIEFRLAVANLPLQSLALRRANIGGWRNVSPPARLWSRRRRRHHHRRRHRRPLRGKGRSSINWAPVALAGLFCAASCSNNRCVALLAAALWSRWSTHLARRHSRPIILPKAAQ